MSVESTTSVTPPLETTTSPTNTHTYISLIITLVLLGASVAVLALYLIFRRSKGGQRKLRKIPPAALSTPYGGNSDWDSDLTLDFIPPSKTADTVTAA